MNTGYRAVENIELQNRVLRYAVTGLLILLLLLGIITAVYISDTAELRRDMLDYAKESIKLQYEQLRAQKEESLNKGYEELEQLELLIDDYKNNSMEMDDLLRGMESEIERMKERS